MYYLLFCIRFSSWGNLPLQSYWSLSCDHGLLCSDGLTWEQQQQTTTNCSSNPSAGSRNPAQPTSRVASLSVIRLHVSPCLRYKRVRVPVVVHTWDVYMMYTAVYVPGALVVRKYVTCTIMLASDGVYVMFWCIPCCMSMEIFIWYVMCMFMRMHAGSKK